MFAVMRFRCDQKRKTPSDDFESLSERIGSVNEEVMLKYTQPAFTVAEQKKHMVSYKGNDNSDTRRCSQAF